MPTQEDRLTALEQNFMQFKAETIRTYQDMAMHVTMIKGLNETIIGRLATMQWQADQRFNVVETRLDRIEATLGSHTSRLDQIDATLANHTALLSSHTALLNEHTKRLDQIDATLGSHTALLTEILKRLPEKP